MVGRQRISTKGQHFLWKGGSPGSLISTVMLDAERCYSLLVGGEENGVSLPINQGDSTHPWHSQLSFSSKSWHQIAVTI